MKYHLEQKGDEVIISFEDVGEQAQAVIEAIGRCRQRAGQCSSGECVKIASMETFSNGKELGIKLMPRTDADLSVVRLGECIKYQLPKEIES